MDYSTIYIYICITIDDNPDNPIRIRQDRAHTLRVKQEFCDMYPNRFLLFLQELLSVLVTPFYLFWVARAQTPNVLRFLQRSVITVDGVGHVCRYSTFDFSDSPNKPSNPSNPQSRHSTSLSSSSRPDQNNSNSPEGSGGGYVPPTLPQLGLHSSPDNSDSPDDPQGSAQESLESKLAQSTQHSQEFQGILARNPDISDPRASQALSQPLSSDHPYHLNDQQGQHKNEAYRSRDNTDDYSHNVSLSQSYGGGIPKMTKSFLSFIKNHPHFDISPNNPANPDNPLSQELGSDDHHNNPVSFSENNPINPSAQPSEQRSSNPNNPNNPTSVPVGLGRERVLRSLANRYI